MAPPSVSLTSSPLRMISLTRRKRTARRKRTKRDAGADEEGDEEDKGAGHASGAGSEEGEEPEDKSGKGNAPGDEEEPENDEDDGGNGAVREPSVSADDAAAEAVQEEAQAGTGYSIPATVELIAQEDFKRQPLPIEEQMLARSLHVRFKSTRGGFDIVAPGRVVRRLVGMGDPMPMRLSIPGKESPAPNLVLCLDVSGSMNDSQTRGGPKKITLATTAARVLATAIERVGGHVVGLLFGERSRSDHKWGADALFSSPQARDGSTDFTFLSEAWRRWEGYWFVIVTDGQGDNPSYHLAEPTRPAQHPGHPAGGCGQRP